MSDKTGKDNMLGETDETFGTVYGLFLSFDGPSQQAIVDALMKPAKKKVEVAVKYQGVMKEYTFAEFFKRLGFYDDVIEGRPPVPTG